MNEVDRSSKTPEPRTYNRLLGLFRLLALYALVGTLLYFSQPTRIGVSCGLVLVILGESLRFWSAGHLRKTSELVTSGPYRYTRNPLYLGRLLIFSGLCVMARLPHGIHWLVLGAGWVVFFGYYMPRKERVEPDRLIDVHGESYARYRRAVPALFPSLKPYPDAIAGPWSLARMLRNREHWMVLGLLAASVLLAWRAYFTSGS
jgi:protein-S-isoprenylcysteine O-methyltransferase Ste14